MRHAALPRLNAVQRAATAVFALAGSAADDRPPPTLLSHHQRTVEFVTELCRDLRRVRKQVRVREQRPLAGTRRRACPQRRGRRPRHSDGTPRLRRHRLSVSEL